MTEIIKVSKTDVAILDDLVNYMASNTGNGSELPTIISLEKLLEDDRSYLFAAIIDGKVVGYSLTYRFPSLYSETSLAYLYDIEVLKNHRRKGIGKLLISAMLTCLKSVGVSEVWLGTAVDNPEGQGLFTSSGAKKSGETFNDYTYDLSGLKV